MYNSLIDSINTEIVSFNSAVRTAHSEILGGDGFFPVVTRLSNLGTRLKNNCLREHMGAQWREKEFDRKLHLGDKLLVPQRKQTNSLGM